MKKRMTMMEFDCLRDGCRLLTRLALVAGMMALAGCEEGSDVADSVGVQAETGDTAVEDGSGAWRHGRDVAVLNARNNAVMWETRNVEAPLQPNLPGDCEWIIARIEGQGFRRLLIATMHTSGGARSPSRIFFESNSGYELGDGRFPVPLPGPSLWHVECSGGALRVFLDGAEIWSAAGNYSVDRAVMTDNGRRGFLGEWRAVYIE